MSGLSEENIQSIVERVTQQVLNDLKGALLEVQADDAYPEWDELNVWEDQANDERIDPVPIPRHSALRTRSAGIMPYDELVGDAADAELPYSVTIGGQPAATAAPSGFTPGGTWLAAQMQRDGYLKNQPPAHALDALGS